MFSCFDRKTMEKVPGSMDFNHFVRLSREGLIIDAIKWIKYMKLTIISNCDILFSGIGHK